jgi:hypothetical protein
VSTTPLVQQNQAPRKMPPNQICEKMEMLEARNRELELQLAQTKSLLKTALDNFEIYQNANNNMPTQKNTDVIKLDVGGVDFQVREDILTAHGDTFFTCLLSHEEMIERDNNGNIFIDRDPTLFVCVLDLLRSGCSQINHQLFQRLGYDRLVLLKHELHFYQLKNVLRHVDLYIIQLLTVAQRNNVQ